MRKLFFIILLLVQSAFMSNGQPYGKMQARHTSEWFTSGYTYQIQPRAFTTEGTIAAAADKLQHLSELGVKTVYLCPVFVTDDDPDQSSWSPRQIQSGYGNPKNPYRIKDYFHVDPEYGTDADLKDFVAKAHSLGIHVLLDIVFDHCGPTAVFVDRHPEFFSYDENGKMITTQWRFPALNFQSAGLRAYLKTNMQYLMCEFDVDGFRCDVADGVPLDFWVEARAELEKIKSDFVLAAEGQKRDNTLQAFDANYDWEIVLNVAAALLKNPDGFKDKGGAAVIREKYESYMAEFPQGTLFWHFTENHDTSNDSYDNRSEKVYGHANQELGLALCFALDGIPLIYNGQEICDASRHSIFSTHGAAVIDWSLSGSDAALHRMDCLKGWAKMRSERPALIGGATIWIDNDRPAQVCSFRRSDGLTPDVLFVGNFSPDKVTVRLADGSKFTLAPWGYVFR